MKGKVNNMAGRYGDKNPHMKYYDDYRNKYYNPDDEINRPGRNVNWKDIQQGFSLAAAKDDEQDSSITELEEKNTEQDGRLDTLEETAANHDTRLDAIENEQEEQNGRLTAIETEQTAQNNRLNAIETEQTAQNNRLDAIETKNEVQDQDIAAIKTRDAEQDQEIANIDNRLADAEQDIQNENQRNTAQDQSISDNSVRITRLESSQATQDQQITSLITTSVDHGAAINNLNQQVAAAADKVRRVATDPPTSRSTRLGSDESNLTISAAKDAEGTSVQITDTAGGDPIRVGFESDAGGDSIIIGNNSYPLGGNGGISPTATQKLSKGEIFVKAKTIAETGITTVNVDSLTVTGYIPNHTYNIYPIPFSESGVVANFPYSPGQPFARSVISSANGTIEMPAMSIEVTNLTHTSVTKHVGIKYIIILSH